MSLFNNRIPISPIQSESPLSDAITIRDRRLLIRSNINLPSVVLKHSKLWFTQLWHQPQLQLIRLDNTADLPRLRTQIRWLCGSAEFYNHNILIKSAHKFCRIIFHQTRCIEGYSSSHYNYSGFNLIMENKLRRLLPVYAITQRKQTHHIHESIIHWNTKY